MPNQFYETLLFGKKEFNREIIFIVLIVKVVKNPSKRPYLFIYNTLQNLFCTYSLESNASNRQRSLRNARALKNALMREHRLPALGS
jgi:hypothetical protein